MIPDERRPLHLAALANAAVRGLDPAGVAEVYDAERGHLAVLVVDRDGNRWLVEEPLTAVDSAAEDITAPLLPLLSSHLPFAVPRPEGSIVVKGRGRITVTPWIEDHRIGFDDVPPGPGLAAEIGRTLAAVHNLDPALYDEAGVPAYDAEAYRRRRLAEVDRAATTGHVPAGLLARWEQALELVPLWRFATTPVHGSFDGDAVRVRFRGDDVTTATVTALTSWQATRVADPADDFAALYDLAHPDTFDTVLEAYAQARTERPDRGLETRARLYAELEGVTALLRAHAAGDRVVVEEIAGQLRLLDAETADNPIVRPTPVSNPRPAVGSPAASAAPAGPVEDAGEDEVTPVTTLRPLGVDSSDAIEHLSDPIAQVPSEHVAEADAVDATDITDITEITDAPGHDDATIALPVQPVDATVAAPTREDTIEIPGLRDRR